MPIYEGTTVEEAIQKGLQAMQLTKDEVDIQILSEGKKGFLGFGKKVAQVSMEATVSEEISESIVETAAEVLTVAAEQPQTDAARHLLENLADEEAITELALYLTEISKELRAAALVRVERTDAGIVFHLDSAKPGILIGKHGKVLNALQYIAQVFIHRIAANKLSVIVNVGDYREKRQEILQRLAQRTAEKVKRTGQPVFLEPMSAFERKQIHYTLSKDEAIQTHSEGDEPYRYLVVAPIAKK